MTSARSMVIAAAIGVVFVLAMGLTTDASLGFYAFFLPLAVAVAVGSRYLMARRAGQHIKG